jgi:hypothetical protein
MPLEFECADVVRFECAKCERGSSLRALQRAAGHCEQCGGGLWTLITDYFEPNAAGVYQRSTVLPAALQALVEWLGWNRRGAYEGEVLTLRTPEVPARDALAVAQAPFAQRGHLAYAYMKLRRDSDGLAERERLRQRGGGNCVACGVFFVPHPDKPWTKAGCCSKGCQAKSSQDAIDFQESDGRE